MRRAQWVDPDWKAGWGFGLHVAHRETGDLVGHMGSVPGYFSTTYIDHKRKIGVIVLANSMDAQPYIGQPRSITERVFDWLGPAIVKAVEQESAEADPPAWSRLEGTYRCIWADVCVLSLDGKLLVVDPNQQDPKATAFTLEPLPKRKNTFLIADGPENQLVGEELVFEFTSDGQPATGLSFSSTRFRRVEPRRARATKPGGQHPNPDPQ